MKKLVFVALLLMAMNHASMANPKNPDKAGARLNIISSPDHQKKATIQISNLDEARKSFLKIKDNRGRLLHSETIHNQSSFTRTYDFSNLKGEKYIVEVRTKEGVASQTFNVKAKKDRKVYFKPVIKTEKDVIKVVFKNPMSDPLSLRLYDANGQVVYTAKVPSQEVFSTGLDVSKLRSKQYKLSIWNSDYVYSKNINTR